MTVERKNFVAYSCGRKGTGKSTLLARYASRFPRRLILDTSAEFYGKYPGAYECLTYRATLDALEDAAPRSSWIVVACLLPKESAKIFGILSPLRNPVAGYSVAVGGVMVECGEVDTVMPNHKGISAEAANIIHRGRHSLVSLAVGSRRPADVNRLLTSQADVVACFQQYERNDIEYLASVVGENNAAMLSALPDYHHLQYLPQSRRAYIVDPRGVISKNL